MKLKKLMVEGKWQKVNGKFIKSIGYFAFDGCHKIYILENKKDLDLAMSYGYRLYPDFELKKTFDDACPLKFIENMSLTKYYVKQFDKAVWTEKKATKKEIDDFLKQD